MSIAALVDHIRALVVADATLSGLNLGLVNYGIPTKLPAIYIDGLTFVDDKQSSHSFNLCYVTTDLGVGQIDVAHKVLTALKQSNCIQAQGLLPRPEPELKRNRWFIPCIYYPAWL